MWILQKSVSEYTFGRRVYVKSVELHVWNMRMVEKGVSENTNCGEENDVCEIRII